MLQRILERKGGIKSQTEGGAGEFGKRIRSNVSMYFTAKTSQKVYFNQPHFPAGSWQLSDLLWDGEQTGHFLLCPGALVASFLLKLQKAGKKQNLVSQRTFLWGDELLPHSFWSCKVGALLFSSKMDLFACFFIVVRTPSMSSTLWINLQVHSYSIGDYGYYAVVRSLEKSSSYITEALFQLNNSPVLFPSTLGNHHPWVEPRDLCFYSSASLTSCPPGLIHVITNL